MTERATTAAPAGAITYDLSGLTVTPGWIDTHVHLIILGHGDYDRWDPWIAKNHLVERVMEKEAIPAGQLGPPRSSSNSQTKSGIWADLPAAPGMNSVRVGFPTVPR